MTTAAEQLGRFAAEAEPPSRLARRIGPAAADCFGCILAGAGSAAARQVATALAQLGGGEVPLYGQGPGLPAGAAALANAVAGHAWDLDDWEEPANTHPTIVLLPALLAAAHLRRLSGTEMLAAYAAGYEAIVRLGEAVTLDHYARGFHSTATLGAMGSAAACARGLGLSAEEAAHAIAISASQAAGYWVQFGSTAKPLQAGFAARAGLEAAVLARAGATGRPDVLEHENGFAGLMGNATADSFASAMAKLGRPWAVEEWGLFIKPWPSCSYIHRLMTAALELRPRLEGRFSRIVHVEAELPDFHRAILPFDRPASRTEALFSIPACLAQVLVTGNLTLADSASSFWQGGEVARLIPLTQVIAAPARNPALNYDPGQPDRLKITLDNGDVLETVCHYPVGAPRNPLTTEQLSAKFHAITGRPAEGFPSLVCWTEAHDIAEFFKENSL